MLKSNKLLFLFLILFSWKITANAIVTPTDRFYINDYANILSDETENHIYENSKNLNTENGKQIVVVTVKNLEGLTIEEYALTLARNFKIGDKKENNGLLILLSLEDREIRVEVGYGLEGILPDGKTGRIIDEYMISYLKQNDWDKAIKNGYNAFFNEVSENIKLDAYIKGDSSNEKESNNRDIWFYICLTTTIIYSLIVHYFIYSNKKKDKIIGIILSVIFLTIGIILCFVGDIIIHLMDIIIFIYLGLVNWKTTNSGSNSSKGGRYYSFGSGGSFSSRSSGGGGSFGGGGASRKF